MSGRGRWQRLRVASLATVMLLARPAHAEDNVAPTAETLVQRGVELRRAGRDGEALVQFQQAYSLVPTPRTQAQIGLALQALGDWLGAERSLEEALRAGQDPWIAQYRAELDGALGTVRVHLAHLYVDVNVSDGQLLLDGVSVHALPTKEAIRVRAGTLDIEVRAPGYTPMRRTVDVGAGTDVHESFSLEPLVAPPPPATADATPSGGTPPEQPKRRSHVGTYVMLGAAAALAGGGIVAWRVEQDNISIYNDDGRCVVGTLTRAQRCGSYERTGNVALGLEIGAFAASGVAVGIGAALLWAPSRPPARTAQAWCGTYGTFGLGCGGRF